MTALEQRRYLRQETEIAVTIYKEDEKIPATMIDISEGGIAIMSERGLFPGTKVHVMMTFIDDYSIHGTIRWVYQVQDGGKIYYRTGIETNEILDTEDIVAAASPERSGEVTKHKQRKMEEIAWDQHFSVGIEKFDEQHKELILKINRLINNPQATTGSGTVSGLLIEMTQYAREHFTAEEDLMAQSNYPDREEHVRQHSDFRNKTAEFCLAVMDKKEIVSQKILEYLGDWLVNHILKADKPAYSYFFKGPGVGQEDGPE